MTTTTTPSGAQPHGVTPLIDFMDQLIQSDWTVFINSRFDGTWEARVSRRLYERETHPYYASGKCISSDPAYALARAYAMGEADLRVVQSMPNPKPERPKSLFDLLGPAITARPITPSERKPNLRRFG